MLRSDSNPPINKLAAKGGFSIGACAGKTVSIVGSPGKFTPLRGWVENCPMVFAEPLAPGSVRWVEILSGDTD